VAQRRSIESVRVKVAHWLSQGISPRRLALTLALGFAIGCIPVVGIPTVLCAGLALALRLNLPAIQAANYAAMPLQLALIVPFARLGGRLFSSAPHTAAAPGAWLHLSAPNLMAQSGAFMGHALAGWVLIAAPAVLILFAPLTLILRRVPALSRIPALADAEAGD
jgi:uncharacterized protein (DUF2062 family)